MNKSWSSYYWTLAALFLISCVNERTPKLAVDHFGSVEGKDVQLYTVRFDGQLVAKVTNYGGIITSLEVPDKNGAMADVVLGYDDLKGYLDETPYFGALIGRYGNRIDEGRFSLDGKEYQLATNNAPNHLHGGNYGFDKVVWDVVGTQETATSVAIVLSYKSVEGQEGYPGTLAAQVTYTFTTEGLTIDYEATTDAPTVVNLTQHTYFNLSGDASESVLRHELQLEADRFLPVDSTLIPTGELRAVAGTPFDFTRPKTIGQDIDAENRQLTYGLGYDHCWVLNGGLTDKMRKVGSLYHPGSGRFMEISTVEPGMQFYSGNFLDGSLVGKKGVRYPFRHGLCLETQHYPDSPNQPGFPSVVLRPNERYRSQTRYIFSIQ